MAGLHSLLSAPSPKEDSRIATVTGLHSLLSASPDKEDSRIATVVVRGSTANIMDDVERAVDDAVNSFKSLTKDARFVPGAGATEIELAKQLTSFGEVMPRHCPACLLRVACLPKHFG